MHVIFYDGQYHTWNVETQEYGTYGRNGERAGEEGEVGVGGGTEGGAQSLCDDVDGEPLSDSELDGEAIGSEDEFQDKVRGNVRVGVRMGGLNEREAEESPRSCAFFVILWCHGLDAWQAGVWFRPR